MYKIFLLLFLIVYNTFGFESFYYINKNYQITQTADLEKHYKTDIYTYFDKEPLLHFITNDDIKIAYKVFVVSNAKANIVISSGRTESMIKYKEFIYDLNRNGYSVYIYDHRGQGLSQRLLEERQLGHVNNFFDYVDDMKLFVNKIVPKNRKVFLLGHSMGGAIASLYVEKYIHDFDALVLSSPMHQPDLVSSRLSKMLCYIVEKRKENIDRYILGENSYDDERVTFKENKLTHSQLRFDITAEEYEKTPQVKIGGPSVRWVSEACKWSRSSVLNAYKIKVPVLLIQAAEDKIVNMQPQEIFCENALGFCKGLKIDNAYHELFMEEDEIRNKAMSAMFDFFKLQESR